jgi:RNA polymerase sigma-70 factor, ECF subfamily
MNKNNSSIQSIALDFLKNKNNKTFTRLVNRIRPGLYSYAYNFVKDKDIANDVVSQTFISIWEKIEQYKTEFNFSTWAYTIAKHECFGILRNKNKILSYDKYMNNHSKLLQLYNPVFNMNTECLGLDKENMTQKLYDASISAIKELDEPYKSVMIEREINQKQLNEIAKDLNMNLSTVKTRLRKGRKDIAEKLYKKYPDIIDSYFGNESEE